MGSTLHLSNRSGETLTRLTAAQGLCSTEKIASIVFFLFLPDGGIWGGTVGDEGQGFGSSLEWYKSNRMCQKCAPNLKGSSYCPAGGPLPGWWSLWGER